MTYEHPPRGLRRYGDQYHCSACGKQWDIDDKDVPDCKPPVKIVTRVKRYNRGFL